MRASTTPVPGQTARYVVSPTRTRGSETWRSRTRTSLGAITRGRDRRPSEPRWDEYELDASEPDQKVHKLRNP